MYWFLLIELYLLVETYFEIVIGSTHKNSGRTWVMIHKLPNGNNPFHPIMKNIETTQNSSHPVHLANIYREELHNNFIKLQCSKHSIFPNILFIFHA